MRCFVSRCCCYRSTGKLVTFSLSYLLLAVFSTGLLNKSLCSLLFLVKAPENNYLSQLHPCSLPGVVGELMEQAEVCRVSLWGLVQSQEMLHLALNGTFTTCWGIYCCRLNHWNLNTPFLSGGLRAQKHFGFLQVKTFLFCFDSTIIYVI